MVYLVTGKKNAGKTTWLKTKITELKDAAGFYSNKIHDCGRVTSYELVNFKTGETKTVAKLVSLPKPTDWGEDVLHGPFRFNSSAFIWAMAILNEAKTGGVRSFLIDELGKLELHGEGLVNVVREALKTDMDLYISIRDTNIKEAVRIFGISDYSVINAVD